MQIVLVVFVLLYIDHSSRTFFPPGVIFACVVRVLVLRPPLFPSRSGSGCVIFLGSAFRVWVMLFSPVS